MLNYKAFSLIILTTAIAACNTHKEPVPVVQDTGTQLEYVPVKGQKLPKNVTAICVDGSYSTAPIEQACLGHGGKKEIFSRYHAD